MILYLKSSKISFIIFGLSLIDYVYTFMGIHFNYIKEVNNLISFVPARALILVVVFFILSYIEYTKSYKCFLYSILGLYILLLIYHNILFFSFAWEMVGLNEVVSISQANNIYVLTNYFYLV